MSDMRVLKIKEEDRRRENDRDRERKIAEYYICLMIFCSICSAFIF